MKKINFLLLGICCLLLVSCSNGESKKVISVDDFQMVSLNNNFEFRDNMESYPGVSYIKEAKKAVLDSTTIEMIVYDTVDNAKNVQDNQISNFKKIKNTAAPESKEEGDNYYKYSMVSNGYYMVSSRVENTLVFCKTTLDNKEKVEKVLEEIGY